MFLNLKLRLLSKFEAKETSPRFSSFDFGKFGSVANVSHFSLNHIVSFWFLPHFIFLSFLNIELQLLLKFEVKGKFLKFPSFPFRV